jgi:acyl-CoA dehydrogenase
VNRLPKRVALTSIGLDAFYEPRHHALAGRMAEVAEELLAAHHGPDARHEAEALALDLGRRFDLQRYLVPAEAGGAPGGRADTIDVRALSLIREALGYASPLADALFAVQGLGAFPIAVAGSDAQKERVAELIDGTRIAAFALTEPEAGSDVASLRTEARREGDEWILDGEKTLISNVPIADVYVVFANADPARGRQGITAFLVEAGTAGLGANRQPMSIDHPIGTLRLEGCRVGPESVLGEVGQGFKLAMQTLETFRISVGAAACGMGAAALEDALLHVERRVQFGKPLSSQQLVQAYLADMATDLDASRLLVARAAHAKDTRSGRPTAEVAMAKMFATEAAQRIIDKAVQLHGGRGVLSGTRVEALYREIRPLRIYEGTTEIQKLIIARALLESKG